MFATTENGRLQLDFETVIGHPYRRGLRGVIARYTAESDTKVFESVMGDNDTAYVGRTGMMPSFTYVGSGGSFQIAPFSSIGIEELDPGSATMLQLLQEQEIEYEGWKSKVSVTQICGQIMRETGTLSRQLPIRWRRMSHEAIHQGPMIVCRGGAQAATQYDRKQAFLAALYEPVPVPGTHTAVSPVWRRLRATEGFVRARVYVKPDSWEGKIPPLPLRRNGQNIYPTGTFFGCWTIPHLRLAEEMGVEVLEVYEAIQCKVAPIHAEAAKRMSEVKSKALRKSLYTRYWGRMASQGGWRGTIGRPNDVAVSEVHKFRGSRLFWVWAGKDVDTSFDFPKDYMPDHSAYIASRNSIEMAIGLSAVDKYKTVAAHVDAIWVDGEIELGSSFAVKGEGELRFYGVGTYNHAGKIAAQGVEGDTDAEEVERHGSEMVDTNREWHFGSRPGQDRTATSDPIFLDGEVGWFPNGKTVYDENWTPTGWLAPKETSDELENG